VGLGLAIRALSSYIYIARTGIPAIGWRQFGASAACKRAVLPRAAHLGTSVCAVNEPLSAAHGGSQIEVSSTLCKVSGQRQTPLLVGTVKAEFPGPTRGAKLTEPIVVPG